MLPAGYVIIITIEKEMESGTGEMKVVTGPI